MADTKISDLASGAPAQATDEFVAARAGTNVKLTFADLTTVPEINLPGSVDANDVLTIEAGDNTADRTIALTATAAGVSVNLDAGRLNVLDPVQATRYYMSNGGTHGTSIYDDGAGSINLFLDDLQSSAGLIAQASQVANIGRFKMNSDGKIGFAAAGASAGDYDTAIQRDSAGVMRVIGAGTALGKLKAGVAVVENTGTVSPAIADSGTLYTNTGDADGSIVNLPNDPTIGTYFEFAVMAAQALDVVPASGESIRDGASTGTTKITSNTVGSTLRLVAVTGGSGAVWLVMSKTGTWTVS